MATDSTPSDREVLLLFKRNTGGDYWTNREGWDDNFTNLDTWFGVTAAANGRVVKLELLPTFREGRFLRLVGGIPAELGQLSSLRTLNLCENQLTGGIPAELCQLSSLHTLNLSRNQLTGGIPAELCQLSSLHNLHLSDNQLTGGIPAELCQLSSLHNLKLSRNQLTGGIPAELCQLSSLHILKLCENQLTGGIPAELCQLSSLHILNLSRNQMTGGIPAELCQLSSLHILYLCENQLTGVIPAELGQLSSLHTLHISDNKLTGGIPAELCQLSNLHNLKLSRNQLAGGIPAELCQLSSLHILKLCENQLTGGIPAELGQLSSLHILHLSRNQMTGGIPAELCQLSSLHILNLCENQLTGVIPAELGQLSSLHTLHLSDNQLTGGIPAELCQLSSLHNLKLSRNQLAGGIPAELCQLSSLHILKLCENQLTGVIPAELGQLSSLHTLHLSDNQLTGGIPAELGQLSSLHNLKLSRNQLADLTSSDREILLLFKRYTDGDYWMFKEGWDDNVTNLDTWSGVTAAANGRVVKLELVPTLRDGRLHRLVGGIPAELGQLSSLRTLNLCENQLTGVIPAELGQLSSLRILHLSHNQLTGRIPAELGQLSSLDILNLCENQLTGDIPAELGQLSSLHILKLSRNQLTGGIPAKLCHLSNLHTLFLSHNQLTGGIPAKLCHLSNLHTLFLSHNQLTGFGDVEDALKLVNRVPRILLDDNPWRMPPEGVVNQGLDAVKTYLKDVKDAKDTGALTKSLELLKVVLVGSSGAGKTSLINSIINDRAAPTERDPSEASTVGIELQTRNLGNTTVEFYDCAGQLDYAGMHQTFLSKRALYLLVWDVTTCRDLSTRKNSEFDKVIREKIMPWLTILHLRAPNATVILVANKCERAIEKYSEIADKVEKRVRVLLDEWQRKRGLGDRDRSMTTLSWLWGRNLISCQDYTGISKLVQRISDFGSTSIEVPPSWDLALTVVNALREDRAPLAAASERFKLTETSSYTARKGKWAHTFVTREELLCELQSVVRWLKERGSQENFHAKELAALFNPESALEGALWISEFSGRILRFDGGERIFLDVVWLSEVLSPILSHKLESEPLPSLDLSPLRDDLVHKGILRVAFARYLWRNVLDSSAIEANHSIVKGLHCVLLELGVILPLGRTFSTGIDAFTPRGLIERDDTPKDVLVVMRLPKTDEQVSKKLQEVCDKKAIEGATEVRLKWRFDSAGAPEGFVERLIASCHRIGEVEMELCWRYGGFFKSHETELEDGRAVRPFTFMIRYDEVDALRQDYAQDRVLSLTMTGRLEDDTVWKALQYVASAMVILSEEWPGVLWQGWSQCPEHPETGTMYLEPPHEAEIGRPLLPATSVSPCDCSLEENSVQQLVPKRLGNVIDTRKDHPFAKIPSARESSAPNTSPGSRSTVGAVQTPSPPSAPNSSAPNVSPGSQRMFGMVQPPSPTSAPNTPSNQNSTTGEVPTPQCRCCHTAFMIWRENALNFAGTFGGLALTIFFGGTLVGITEGMEVLWIIASIFVGVLALGAIISSAVACRDIIIAHPSNPPPTVATV